jgi:hypothetical protein
MNAVLTMAELDRNWEPRVCQEFPKATLGWREWLALRTRRLFWGLHAATQISGEQNSISKRRAK